MIDPQEYIDGLFINPKITFSRMCIYGDDNADNMENNNPGGIYTPYVTATRAAILNFRTLSSHKSGDIGTRMGGTQTKNIARVHLEVYIADNIGMVRSKLGGKTDPRFIACFPQRMDGFYNQTDNNFRNNVDALIGKAHTYTSELGPDFETDLTALQLAYVNSITAHGAETSDVTTDIVTVQMAADAVSDQLTDNLMFIAHNNRRSKTAAALYFKMHLLYAPKGKEIHKGKIAAHGTAEVCPIEYIDTRFVEFAVTGPRSLSFGMKYEDQKVGEMITVTSGKKAKQQMSFFYTVGTSIYVVNNSDLDSAYTVTVLY